MARKFSLIILLVSLAFGVFAQSGRNKPKPEEKTEKKDSRRVVYMPVEPPAPKPSPTPTATPVKNDSDDDVIRVDSALVPIPVAVTDASGKAVTNLQISDFVLEVDGKQVEIAEISRADTPVRLALLFDNSTSVMLAREFEKKAAIRFFRQVIRPEKDLAALFSVASETRLEQELTKNVSLLVRAIENFAPPKGATALLDGIIQAADYLRTVDGRRVIVIVSDGDDNLSDSTLEETLRYVLASNCQIYVVKTTDFENYKRTGGRGGNANITFLSAERRMQELARQTGGAVYSPVDERELDAAFTRISAELSQQYVLNYYPEDDDVPKGTFREISLKIKDRENLTVRARRGYIVPKK
jgi:Mg-chelatase subunit ChlD